MPINPNLYLNPYYSNGASDIELSALDRYHHLTVRSCGTWPCSWFRSRRVAKAQPETGGKLLAHLARDIGGCQGAVWDMLRDFVKQSKLVKFHPIFSLPIGAKWNRGRCLLLGDAAHAVSPRTSQGTSMALEDVFMLSWVLSEASLHIEEIFTLYDAKRRPRVNEIKKGSKSKWRRTQEGRTMAFVVLMSLWRVWLWEYSTLSTYRNLAS